MIFQKIFSFHTLKEDQDELDFFTFFQNYNVSRRGVMAQRFGWVDSKVEKDQPAPPSCQRQNF